MVRLFGEIVVIDLWALSLRFQIRYERSTNWNLFLLLYWYCNVVPFKIDRVLIVHRHVSAWLAYYSIAMHAIFVKERVIPGFFEAHSSPKGASHLSVPYVCKSFFSFEYVLEVCSEQIFQPCSECQKSRIFPLFGFVLPVFLTKKRQNSWSKHPIQILFEIRCGRRKDDT